MAAHRWTKAQRRKFTATLQKKAAAGIAVGKVKGLSNAEVRKELQKLQPLPPQASVDVRQIERFNYRRGLLDAVEVILREVRQA